MYRVVSFSEVDHAQLSFLPLDRMVTFTSNDSSVPLPSPVLIRAHYIIAKILNVSGIGEMIDRLLSESEFDSHVKSNGSTDLASIICQRLLMSV